MWIQIDYNRYTVNRIGSRTNEGNFPVTILKELDEARIFNTELRENATVIRFKESCDLYFSVDLSKQRLKELIGELEELHDQMRTGLKRGT